MDFDRLMMLSTTNTQSNIWSLATPTYTGNNAYIYTDNMGIDFTLNGTRLYVLNGGDNDWILQYDLYSGYAISSITNYASRYSLSGISSAGIGIRVAPNGTDIFVLGSNSTETVMHHLTLANATDDISTATNQEAITISGITSVLGFEVANDGYTVYLTTGSSIYQAQLSTAWDFNTMGALSAPINLSAQCNKIRDLREFFKQRFQK